jgi:hypothetical protein
LPDKAKLADLVAGVSGEDISAVVVSAAVASAGGASGDMAAAISRLQGPDTRKGASVAGNFGCRQPPRVMVDASLEREAL